MRIAFHTGRHWNYEGIPVPCHTTSCCRLRFLYLVECSVQLVFHTATVHRGVNLRTETTILIRMGRVLRCQFEFGKDEGKGKRRGRVGY